MAERETVGREPRSVGKKVANRKKRAWPESFMDYNPQRLGSSALLPPVKPHLLKILLPPKMSPPTKGSNT